jgi:hypothetical protein
MDCICTWAKTLNAKMIPLEYLEDIIRDKISSSCDIAVFIMPKNDRRYDELIIPYMQKFPNILVGIMQEGPINYFENWAAQHQYNWLKLLDGVDFLLAHNQQDCEYISYITRHHDTSFELPTLYDDEFMPKPLDIAERHGIMLAGCPGNWYNVMPALKLCLDIGVDRIGIPGVGRITNEHRDFLSQFQQITIYPWLNWADWLDVLKTYKIGINLMSARAAGTFNLNCAALNIPCIGFEDVNTQFHAQPNELCLDRNCGGDYYKNLKCLIIHTLDHTEKGYYHISDGAGLYSVTNNKNELQNLFKDIVDVCSIRDDSVTA